MNLSNVYFGAVMDNAVVVILVHIFCFTYILILIGYMRVELLAIVCMYLQLWWMDTARQFPKVVVPIYTPPNNVCEI